MEVCVSTLDVGQSLLVCWLHCALVSLLLLLLLLLRFRGGGGGGGRQVLRLIWSRVSARSVCRMSDDETAAGRGADGTTAWIGDDRKE